MSPSPPNLESDRKATSLAARLAGWASNLLASGVILIATLVFGRQVIQWWHSPPPARQAEASGPARDPRQEFLTNSWIEFGDSPVAMRRTVHPGAVASVLAELRRGCRQSIALSLPSQRLPGPAEQQLLARIRQREPVEREPGQWSIYQLEQPVPIVVAVAEGPDNAPGKPQVAVPARRVISWGLAFPSAPEQQNEQPTDSPQWTLFVWTSESQQPTRSGRVDAPKPPHSRRTVTLYSDDGGSVCGIVGEGSPLDWREFYDRWHDERKWSATGSWQEMAESWHRHYDHPSLGAADVHFSQAADGTMRGFWLHGKDRP